MCGVCLDKDYVLKYLTIFINFFSISWTELNFWSFFFKCVIKPKRYAPILNNAKKLITNKMNFYCLTCVFLFFLSFFFLKKKSSWHDNHMMIASPKTLSIRKRWYWYSNLPEGIWQYQIVIFRRRKTFYIMISFLCFFSNVAYYFVVSFLCVCKVVAKVNLILLKEKFTYWKLDGIINTLYDCQEYFYIFSLLRYDLDKSFYFWQNCLR